MKGVETALKIKKRELSEEERRLKELLLKVEELKEREREALKRLGLIKNFKVRNPIELGLCKETGRVFLKEITQLRIEIETLRENIEKQRERVAVKRGEVRAIEQFIERRKREKEKREELLLERFVHEIFVSRFNS